MFNLAFVNIKSYEGVLKTIVLKRKKKWMKSEKAESKSSCIRRR